MKRRGGNSKLGSKRTYAWRISTREAQELLQHLVDYVVLKKDQVQVALEFLEIPAGPWGSAGIPQDITHKREEYKRALSALKHKSFDGLDEIDLTDLDCAPQSPQLELWSDN
jgi:hypothetical protein